MAFMTDDFYSHSRFITERAHDVFAEKNADYARETDVLAAFHATASELQVPPRIVWAVHFSKQSNALLSWARNGLLAGENLDSRLADAHSYLTFASLIQQEESHDY